MILHTYWTILIIFFTIFLIYCNVTIQLVFKSQNYPSAEKSKTSVHTIVAYSLKKQIEIEGEEYICKHKVFSNVTSEKLGRSNDEFWNKVEGTEVYISSVTLDRRLEPYQYLRIIGVIKGSWNDTIYCQILTHGDHLQVIKSTVIPIWYEKWDLNDDNTYYNPTLISCRLPVQQNNFLLKAFSLTKSPCKLANRFYEIPRPVNEKLRNFTICVKPLNFNRDISKHLVQWIEICKILGAEYFYIFLGNITKNTRRILEWYKANFPNMIYLQDFKPVYSNYTTSRSLLHRTWQRRRYEIIAYNHCFYKNINSKYIIPIDTDELIVPKVTPTWQELVKHLNNTYSSLIIQNVYFFSKGKSYLNKPFFLKEITRTKLVSKKGENSKSLISTKNTLTVFNHYSLHLLRPGVIKEYFFPFRDVQLNHYKESCNSVIFPECSKYLSSPRIIDNVMFKYRDRFIQQYRDVLNKIREDKIKL